METKDLGHKIIKKIAENKNIQAEVFIIESKTTSIVISNKKVEDCKISDNQGVGLRILSEGRWGSAYTSSFDGAELDRMIDMAQANVEHTSKDGYNRLPEFDKKNNLPSDDIGIYDPELKKISLDDKIKKITLMEEKALSYDKRVKNIPQAFYSDTEFRTTVINSLGIDASYKGTGCSVSLVALAEGNGQTQIGGEFSTKRFYKDLEAEQVGTLASWRAVSMLGAQPVKTKKTDIIFDPLVGCEFLSLIAGGLCADSVQRGKSLFKDKVNKKIASSLVNIQDDGTLYGGIATSGFDDEGVPTQQTVLVKDGILQAYLYDTYTAGKDKVSSTGNATRGSFKGSPTVGTTNFFIEKGKIKKEDLIKKTKEGFYILEVMGMHMADPISGDFSVGASGLWIRDGEFTRPVQGVTIAGNIIGLLNSIDGIGDDLKFYGGIGSPTIRIKDIMVSGI